MSEKRSLQLRLMQKRIRDSKLKTKIRFSLFFITILTILGIGIFSYQVARRELIRNAEQAVLNLQEQGGKNLDDRVDDFEDATFQILQASGIEKVMRYSAEEAEQKRVVNEGLPTVIIQHSILQKYTDYALLRPKSGMIYSYYRSGQKKLSAGEEERLAEALDELVSLHHIRHWVNYEGQIYFVRQAVSTDLYETGLVCFAVNDAFFDFLGDDLRYLDSSRMLIFSRQGETLWGGEAEDYAAVIRVLEERRPEEADMDQFRLEESSDTMAVTVIRTESNGWTLASLLTKQIRRKNHE